MLKSVKKSIHISFSDRLLKWNKERNNRSMPWKGEKDPYKIWLSEIILQQTRVEQGLHYYESFIKTFPDIHQLANAQDEHVFKLWEGLGYYSRCRNLLHTARQVSVVHQGNFPSEYALIRSLKGIGPYTAAAIASFAFELPYAVVDGNVSRVLSRIFGITEPVNSNRGKKMFDKLASELLDFKKPSVYNQAIMDFGATICKPASPACSECIFSRECTAYNQDRISDFPVKDKKIKPRKRWFYYMVMFRENKIAVRQRKNRDIWKELYEFPLIESDAPLDNKSVILKFKEFHPFVDQNSVHISETRCQQLTHQTIMGEFYRLELPKKIVIDESLKWISREESEKLAFPRMLREHILSLSHTPHW